jgi:hypothetical protein
MPRRMLCVLLMLAAGLGTLTAQHEPITRLDGSTMAPSEIDATVTRLIEAAHVTGAGVAMLTAAESFI